MHADMLQSSAGISTASSNHTLYRVPRPSGDSLCSPCLTDPLGDASVGVQVEEGLVGAQAALLVHRVKLVLNLIGNQHRADLPGYRGVVIEEEVTLGLARVVLVCGVSYNQSNTVSLVCYSGNTAIVEDELRSTCLFLALKFSSTGLQADN